MLTSTTVRQKSRGKGPSRWRVMMPRSEIAESEVNRMSMGQMHFYKFTVAISLQPQTSQHLHLHEQPQQKYLSQPPKFTQSVLSLQNKKPNQKSRIANLPEVDPKTYQNSATWQPHNTQKTPVHHRSWTWPKDLPHPCRKPRSKMPPETFLPLEVIFKKIPKNGTNAPPFFLGGSINGWLSVAAGLRVEEWWLDVPDFSIGESSHMIYLEFLSSWMKETLSNWQPTDVFEASTWVNQCSLWWWWQSPIKKNNWGLFHLIRSYQNLEFATMKYTHLYII